MGKDTILLGSFIRREQIGKVAETLEKLFFIERELLMVYEVNGKDEDYLVLFNFPRADQDVLRKEVTWMRLFSINLKMNCIFTINGVNMLMDSEREDVGNVNHPNQRVDFTKYRNKVIITHMGRLMVEDIKKVNIRDLFIEKAEAEADAEEAK